MYGAGAVAIVILIAGAAAGDVAAALVGPWLVLTIVVPAVYGPRWVGSIFAQDYLSADAAGLRYGPNYGDALAGACRAVRPGHISNVRTDAPT